MSKKKSNKKNPVKKQLGLKSSPAWFSNTKLHIAILFIFSFILYGNTLNHDYALDDAIVITDNEYTTKGFAGIPDILSKDTFRGFFKVDGKANLVSGGRYRPLTLIMFAIERSILGDKPFWGHLFNILWFAATCSLLYLLILQIFRDRSTDGFAWFMALGTALIFAAHPIHTECVANIKGRDEIIALLGSLGTAYLILKSWQDKNDMLIIPAAVLFFVSFFSKENTFTFLGVIPLMLFVYTKADAKSIMKKVAPLVLAFVGFYIVRESVLDTNLFQAPLELMNNPFVKIQGDQYVYFSGGEKFATIMYTLLKYIQLLFVPYPLTHDYYPRHIEMMSFANWQVIVSILCHVALLVYGLRSALRKETIGFGILYYLGTLSIVSNLIFPVGTNMAERFLFMPSVGFCMIIAYLLYTLSLKLCKTEVLKNFNQLRPSLLSLGVICAVFAVMTIMRNPVWKDNLTLFTTDAKVSVKSAKLQNAAGGVLIDTYANEKNETLKSQKINEAILHLNQAIATHPNYKNAFLLLGNAHNYLSKYDESIKYYEKAISIDPSYKEAKNNIAITYRDAGRYYGEKKNDINKSIQYLQKAEQAKADDFETLRLLGVAYGMAGQSAKAISYFEKCSKLEPTNAGVWLNLGNAHGQAGDVSKAEQYRAKALQIDPSIMKK